MTLSLTVKEHAEKAIKALRDVSKLTKYYGERGQIENYLEALDLMKATQDMIYQNTKELEERENG
jgi:hypothetical protein